MVKCISVIVLLNIYVELKILVLCNLFLHSELEPDCSPTATNVIHDDRFPSPVNGEPRLWTSAAGRLHRHCLLRHLDTG